MPLQEEAAGRFEKDLDSPEVKSRIDADKKEAAKLRNSGTPGFFVNGKFLRGAKPFEVFREITEAELAAKKRNWAQPRRRSPEPGTPPLW